MYQLAILASGNGTNAEAIMNYFEKDPQINVRLILSNRKDAFVLKRAENHGVEHRTFTRSMLRDGTVSGWLTAAGIDLIVLAGFLWLIPERLIKEYPGRILNIHPALLPAYGGAGMYGDRVHEEVRKSGDDQTGITVHLVNEKYDEGTILLQVPCAIYPDDRPEDIAARVHQLEYEYYPQVIESIVKNL